MILRTGTVTASSGFSSLWIAAVLAATFLLPRPCRAQTTVNVDAGLDGYYKSQRWLPVRLHLTNSGASARAEVRARFATGDESIDEYRLPEREWQGNADQVHTLYVKAPDTLATQPFRVDLYKDGRPVNPIRPRLNLVEEWNWLVLGIGTGDAVSTAQEPDDPPPRPEPAGAPHPYLDDRQPAADRSGSYQEPQSVPDRWQGFQAADMVVLTNSGERDFGPDQLSALRDYVSAGGVLAVAATANWNRLTTPFFKEILPVTVTGARVATSLPELDSFTHSRPPAGGQFTLLEATPRPGAIVKVTHDGVPVVAVGRYGAGRVLYLGIDPSQAPFNNWDGRTSLWKD